MLYICSIIPLSVFNTYLYQSEGGAPATKVTASAGGTQYRKSWLSAWSPEATSKPTRDWEGAAMKAWLLAPDVGAG